jgi:hypothetical protein
MLVGGDDRYRRMLVGGDDRYRRMPEVGQRVR